MLSKKHAVVIGESFVWASLRNAATEGQGKHNRLQGMYRPRDEFLAVIPGNPPQKYPADAAQA
jgi:hypothetical protein